MAKYNQGNHIVAVIGKYGPFIRVEVEGHLSSRIKSLSKPVGTRYLVRKSHLLKRTKYDFH
jgi:hypothetical protein